MLIAAFSALSIALSTASAVAPQEAPALQTVLERAGERVTALCADFPFLVAEEDSQQIVQPYGSNRTDLMRQGTMLGEMGLPRSRKMKADYALVGLVEGGAWNAYRAIKEIDGRRTGEQNDGLARALSESDTPEAEARVLSDKALLQNLGVTRRGVTLSTFGLMVLMPLHQPRFEFSRRGEKRVGTDNVWIVAFTETRRPSLASTFDGQPKPARGELWIEPATGRVVRTHVVFDTIDAFPDMKIHPERYADFPRATIDVVFAPDPLLKTYLPLEMQENYTRKDEVVTCKSSFKNYRRLERRQHEQEMPLRGATLE